MFPLNTSQRNSFHPVKKPFIRYLKVLYLQDKTACGVTASLKEVVEHYSLTASPR